MTKRWDVKYNYKPGINGSLSSVLYSEGWRFISVIKNIFDKMTKDNGILMAKIKEIDD